MPQTTRKSLARLSRNKLLELCLKWSKSSTSEPYLARNRNNIEAEEEDYLHETARKRSDLVDIYETLQLADPDFETLTKKDIIDRIVDGDWRRGLSYKQLAELDFTCLEENDSLLRWSALKLTPLVSTDRKDEERSSKRRKLERTENRRELPKYPNMTPAVFAENLHKHISPLVKANYHIHRLQHLGLSIIRLCITPNTPFAPINTNVPRNEETGLDQSRLIYIALPDSCQYVYVSTTGGRKLETAPIGKSSSTIDIAMLKRVVLEAIPKALSRPQTRWSLEATKVTAKSLKSISLLRGSSSVGVTGGSMANILSTTNGKSAVQHNDPEDEDELDEQHRANKIEQRFGPMSGINHVKLDRFQLRIRNVIAHKPGNERFTEEDQDRTPLTITLNGFDVFAGLKQLALQYPAFVDLDKLPGILTGDSNVTSTTL